MQDNFLVNAGQPWLFKYNMDKQILYFSLVYIYTICSTLVS